MIDSHCHLADEAFASDLESVVDRARTAGLDAALCILDLTNEAEGPRAEAAAALWPQVRFALGIHPHQAARFAKTPAVVDEIVRAALGGCDGARAIGEIGLDYHNDFAPRAVQQEVFRHQVRLARELRRPVVIHTREADDDTVAILQSEGAGDVTGVFHCFTGDAVFARRALDLGFYVSFSGILTFRRAESIREAAAMVPADRLLVETDAPYLAPVPFRGRRNEPAWVARVVETLAEVRGQSVAQTVDETTAAFETLFSEAG